MVLPQSLHLRSNTVVALAVGLTVALALLVSMALAVPVSMALAEPLSMALAVPVSMALAVPVSMALVVVVAVAVSGAVPPVQVLVPTVKGTDVANLNGAMASRLTGKSPHALKPPLS